MKGKLTEIDPLEYGKMNEPWGKGYTLYVVQEEGKSGPVKVGVASHPIRRLSGLQCGNPRKLFLRKIYTGERYYCRMAGGMIFSELDGCRLRGEWFAVSLSSVEAVIDGLLEAAWGE